MSGFQLDPEVVRAAGGGLLSIGDDAAAVSVRLERRDGYGDDALTGAASRFADQWSFACEVLAADLLDLGEAARAAATAYEDSDVAGAQNLRRPV